MDNLLKLIDSKINHQNLITLYDDFNNFKFTNWEEYIDKFKSSPNKSYQKYILIKTDVYELILIKWDKGSETKIHSHQENGCLLKILKGKLKEERFLNELIYKSAIIKENMTSYMHDILGEHKIVAEEDSYSLHLYSPPNFYF